MDEFQGSPNPQPNASWKAALIQKENEGEDVDDHSENLAAPVPPGNSSHID